MSNEKSEIVDQEHQYRSFGQFSHVLRDFSVVVYSSDT